MIIIFLLLIGFLLWRYKKNHDNGKKGLAILDAVLAGIIFLIGLVGKFLKWIFSF